MELYYFTAFAKKASRVGRRGGAGVGRFASSGTASPLCSSDKVLVACAPPSQKTLLTTKGL